MVGVDSNTHSLGDSSFVRAQACLLRNGFAVGHGCGQACWGDDPDLAASTESRTRPDVRLVNTAYTRGGHPALRTGSTGRCCRRTESTLRCETFTIVEYWHSALTVTSLCASRFFSSMRLSANASAGSRVAPLSTISLTSVAIRSRKLVAPGSASNDGGFKTEIWLHGVRSSLTV